MDFCSMQSKVPNLGVGCRDLPRWQKEALAQRGELCKGTSNGPAGRGSLMLLGSIA